MELSIPLIKEQNEIARRFHSIDNKINTEETLLQKYQSVKRGLMGDLLGGGKKGTTTDLT
jgi:restriction endonuclease S subunit